MCFFAVYTLQAHNPHYCGLFSHYCLFTLDWLVLVCSAEKTKISTVSCFSRRAHPNLHHRCFTDFEFQCFDTGTRLCFTFLPVNGIVL